MNFQNAELKRNIWLDFSKHRLILTPVFIGLTVYLFHLINSNMAASAAFYLACFFIYLWGTKNASEAVIDEVNQNTWDFQRQTAMTPFEMSFGKLFGSTLFAWFGAAICLILYIGLRTNLNKSPEGLNQILDFKFLSQLPLHLELFILIASGICVQALALLLSLQVLPKCRRDKNIKTFRYFLIAFIIGGNLSYQAFFFAKLGENTVNWHHITFNQLNFTLVSLAIFLFWSLLGVYRSIAKELQYPNLPWAWCIFSVFCLVYFSGLTTIKDIDINLQQFDKWQNFEAIYKSAPIYTAFAVSLILAYSAILIDNVSQIQYKKVLINFKQNRPLEALVYLPIWTISFIMVLAVGLICLTQPLPFPKLEIELSSSTFVITWTLFLLRDIGLLHYFTFKQSSRVLSTFLLYLFLLYFIIPWILALLNLEKFLPAFVPSFGQNTAIAFISLAIQFVIIGGLLKSKISTSQISRSLEN